VVLGVYAVVTLACAAGTLFGIWRGHVTLSLGGVALGVYYASELRVLACWVRRPDPRRPPTAPAWQVLVCAACFALLAIGATWLWRP